MKFSRIFGFSAAAAVCALTAPAAAQHFSQAYVDVRLVSPDSVVVEVTGDRQDWMNTVGSFPGEDGRVSDNPYRVYLLRLEAYLQNAVRLRLDDARIPLAAIRWKPGGKDRDDWLDSVSHRQYNHVITFGGRLPKRTGLLSVRAKLWEERVDKPPVTIIEYAFLEGDRALRREWARTERWVNLPLRPDSLALLRKTTPPPATERAQQSHAGHGH